MRGRVESGQARGQPVRACLNMFDIDQMMATSRNGVAWSQRCALAPKATNIGSACAIGLEKIDFLRAGFRLTATALDGQGHPDDEGRALAISHFDTEISFVSAVVGFADKRRRPIECLFTRGGFIGITGSPYIHK